MNLDLLDGEEDDKKIRIRYGELLFSRFMTYLTSDKSIWKDRAACIHHCGPAPDNRGKKSKKPKTVTKDGTGYKACH